jgi:2-polyprenyl-3-methyl-5-hydroxy-6-metoxy-1,4-benzoquinol methylase
MPSTRASHEIEHGRRLAASDPESIWGWGTPAGQERAFRRASLIGAAASLQPGIKVLEVGCGTGLFTSLFAQSGASIVAVDISGELLDRARTRGLPPDRVQFLEKRFEDCAVEGPFDAVIGNSILHHLDLDLALPKIHGLLKPLGIMAFAEPNMLNPQIALQKNIPWLKRLLGDSPDETAFIRWRLRGALSRARFEDIAITPFDWLHPSTPSIMIKMVSLLGAGVERIPGLREFAGSLIIRARRGPARVP